MGQIKVKIQSKTAKKSSAKVAVEDQGKSVRTVHVVMSRKSLVGKFPDVKHQPAPKKAHYQLSDEDRKNILAQMVLA